jgi:hypothetical protein
MIAGIIFGIFIFIVLSLTSIAVCHKWNEFKNLRPGDRCGRLVECNSTSEIEIDEIIKVDTDEKGYTTKVYTKNDSYTFLSFMRESIMAIYGD